MVFVPDEPDAPLAAAVPRVNVRSAAMLALIASASIYFLHAAAAVLVPILVSVLLAYALEPFVAPLVRGGVPRIVACVLVYVLLALAVVAIVRGVWRQADAFVAELPATVASMREAFADEMDTAGDSGPGFMDRLHEAAAELNRAAHAQREPQRDVRRVTVVTPRFDVRSALINAWPSVLDAGAMLVVVCLLTFLLLATGDLVRRKLLRLGGREWSERKLTIEVMQTIDRQIERYLFVRLLISVIVATATGLSLWLLGLARPAVWGIVAGVLNTLPFVGPTIAVVLITLSAFLQFQSIGWTAAAGGAALAVAAIEGNLITPVLTSRAAELNTVAVFVAVFFWGWVWGIWGLLLAVPIMVTVKAAADRIDSLHPLGELLGR